jgi:hypothetical protein
VARDDFKHPIVAAITAARNDVGVDQTRWHRKAQARAAPVEKLR